MNSQLTDRGTLRTLVLASLGGALEFYDFVIFVFFASVLGHLFFPPEIPVLSRQLQTYALFAAGYFARPVGGLIMAHFGDTHGRKNMFTLSIALMAVPTLLIAALPTYRTAGIIAPPSLLFLRILQGAAIGGEAPGAWVYVAEHARVGQSGFAVGMLTSGLSLGVLLGSIVATCLDLSFTPAQIAGGWWRAPFVIGGLLGAAAAYLRRWLSETPVFLSIRNAATATKTIPLKTVLTSYWTAIGRSFVLTSFITSMIVVTIGSVPAPAVVSYPRANNAGRQSVRNHWAVSIDRVPRLGERHLRSETRRLCVHPVCSDRHLFSICDCSAWGTAPDILVLRRRLRGGMQRSWADRNS